MQIEYYFERVIKTKAFRVVIEPTGVYFFTRKKFSDSLLEVCRQFADALALNESEWMLVIIDNTKKIKYEDFSFDETHLYDEYTFINEDDIEQFARAVVGHRKICLTSTDIAEIADCYKDEEIIPTEIEEKFMDLGMDFDLAHTIYLKRPQSLQEVSDCGCPSNLVEDVYREMQAYYDSISIQQDSLSDADFMEMINKKATKFFIGGLCLFILALACAANSYFKLVYPEFINFGVGVFSLLGLILASKCTNLTKWMRSSLLFFLCVVLFLYWLYPYAYNWALTFVTTFMESLDSEIGKSQSFWKSLHW